MSNHTIKKKTYDFPKLNRRTGVKTNRATLVKTINRTLKAEKSNDYTGNKFKKL